MASRDFGAGESVVLLDYEDLSARNMIDTIAKAFEPTEGMPKNVEQLKGELSLSLERTSYAVAVNQMLKLIKSELDAGKILPKHAELLERHFNQEAIELAERMLRDSKASNERLDKNGFQA